LVASAPDGQNPFRVLSDSQYRLLFLGTTLSMLAFGMMQVVQQAVAFHLTGKNGAVGFVVLGQGIAMLFLSPLGGTLSDRVSKKRLLTAAQFVIGLMFGTVAVLIALDMITLLLCFFVIFVSISEPKKDRLEAVTEGIIGKFFGNFLQVFCKNMHIYIIVDVEYHISFSL